VEIKNMINKFDFAGTPEIIFGAGKIRGITDIILKYGSRVILLTGSRSFKKSNKFDLLINSFKEKSFQYSLREISGEPTPGNINSIIRDFHNKPVDVVVAIGGGSVVDAGKAVSAMLGKTEPVEEYLEGVGTKTHDGSKIPFIAVPTTSGTGSEATKNTVLSQTGENGYKKSLRHKNFVPDVALVDPELSLTCPSDITAACGMDAFTQLLESYVSTNASPMTDALAYNAIKIMKDSLVPAATSGSHNPEIRSAMSYAALISGITLANAGLGIVHGLAAAIGSYYDIPHGVVCGTLVGVATRINIENLRKDKGANIGSLEKYTEIGKLLSGDNCEDLDQCCDFLFYQMEQWIESLQIPKLSDYGLRVGDIEKIVNNTGNKYNPVKLGKEDIEKIILERI
jgi:alcohol dehydrogenase class IV